MRFIAPNIGAHLVLRIIVELHAYHAHCAMSNTLYLLIVNMSSILNQHMLLIATGWPCPCVGSRDSSGHEKAVHLRGEVDGKQGGAFVASALENLDDGLQPLEGWKDKRSDNNKGGKAKGKGGKNAQPGGSSGKEKEGKGKGRGKGKAKQSVAEHGEADEGEDDELPPVKPTEDPDAARLKKLKEPAQNLDQSLPLRPLCQ